MQIAFRLVIQIIAYEIKIDTRHLFDNAVRGCLITKKNRTKRCKTIVFWSLIIVVVLILVDHIFLAFFSIGACSVRDSVYV